VPFTVENTGEKTK